MNTTSTQELEAQRTVLLRQLRRAGPMVEGSLAVVPRKCASDTCDCKRGIPKHQAMILCKKVSGRSVATYIPKGLWEQVRQWNREHKRVKRVLKEISSINEKIIRRHVEDQRRDQDVRRSLKILPGA